MIGTDNLRERAQAAFRCGDVGEAISLMRSHLAEVADPEVRILLSEALFRVRQFEEARQLLETAMAELTAAGRPERAAIAASRLAVIYHSGLGNKIAARPWFARAWRLVTDAGPCLEQGWVAIADVGCSIDDTGLLRERAELALRIARQFGDVDLEIKALGDSGLAMVRLGEVDEGMTRLDEAMAIISTGVPENPFVAGQTVCSLFTACWHVNDLGRMESWDQVMRERGYIGERGFPILNGHCDSVYGTLLCNLGRWSEAESVLEHGMEIASGLFHAGRLHVHVAMADLRIRQGRLDDAERLLLGYDDHMEALVTMARLHLARGDHELAAGTARRGLRAMGPDRVRAFELLCVLVEAELGMGNLDAASAACQDIDARVGGTTVPLIAAEASFVRARVRAAGGDTTGAVNELDSALAALADCDLPLVKAKLHIELARLHAETDRGAAVAEARAAAAIHSRLEAPISQQAVLVLHRLGVAVPAGDATPLPEVATDERLVAEMSAQDGWWKFDCVGTSFRLRHTKGLAYLAELVAHPGVERHVLDLVALSDPVDAEGAAVRGRLGDAGVMLDARAKHEYRSRLEDLRSQVDDALAVGNDDKACRLEAEIDAIVAELARAVGLGGRDRRAASTAERARLNVTRAVRTAIARIQQADRLAGDALDRDVRTGTFCVYVAEANETVIWTVPTATRR